MSLADREGTQEIIPPKARWVVNNHFVSIFELSSHDLVFLFVW